MVKSLKKNEPIPVHDHVTRYCSPLVIENGMVLSAAFELKLSRDENYLSVNWLEYFEKNTSLAAIIEIRKSLKKKKLNNKDGLIVALKVGEILLSIQPHHEGKVEILFKGSLRDPSYSGVFGFQEFNELAALEMWDLITESMTFRAV